jgi:hypothetical protein
MMHSAPRCIGVPPLPTFHYPLLFLFTVHCPLSIALLMPQRHHGIDLGGPPRGEIACGQGNG